VTQIGGQGFIPIASSSFVTSPSYSVRSMTDIFSRCTDSHILYCTGSRLGTLHGRWCPKMASGTKRGPDFGDTSPITTQHIMETKKYGAPPTPRTPENISTNTL
jgi:hypothetical protein